MTKPIADKAEIALEYPDKLYVGTFERTSRFEAHLDPTGIALIFERPGAEDVRKSIHMHSQHPVRTAPRSLGWREAAKKAGFSFVDLDELCEVIDAQACEGRLRLGRGR